MSPLPGPARMPRGYWPFVVVTVGVQVSLGWPFTHLAHPVGAALAAVASATLVALVLVLTRLDVPRVAAVAPAYVFLVDVFLWRYAAGGSGSGFAPLVVLPVLWLAFNGTLVQVWLSVVGSLIGLAAPMVLLGAPDYPLSDWRRALVWVVVTALIGPTTHRLVAGREAAVRRADALEPARAQLDGLLQAAIGLSVIATDRRGRITAFNRGAERLLGWSAQQAVGQSMAELLHDPDELELRARELGVAPGFDVLAADARSDKARSRPWTYRTRSGGRVPVNLTLAPVENVDGGVLGFIGIASDDSETRTALTALEAERETYRVLVEHLPSMVVGILDSDLRWLTVGGEYHGRRDYRARVGHLVADALEPETAEKIHAFYRRGLQAHVTTEIEIEPGDWLELDALPLTGPDGSPRILTLARDVSARHAAEQERQRLLVSLSADEQRFRTIFDNAPIGVTLSTSGESFDPGPGEPVFIRVNAAFARMLGRDASDLVGTPVAAIAVPEDLGAADAAHAPDERKVVQMRYLHASGRAIWCEVVYTLVRPTDGSADYYLSHVLDVTDRRAAERALLDALERQRAAAEVLHEADAVRNEVMSTVSHELRTPLTSITGYVEVLAEGDVGPLTATQRDMLEIVARNSGRLTHLVDDLLVLARLESSQSRVDSWVELPVRRVVEQAVETIRAVTDQRSQLLVVSGTSTTAVVLGDPEQLDRALTNVLGNAAKYTPVGGRIDVEVVANDQVVEIVVTDTGVGIPSNEINRLFTRFFRASSAQQTGERGTGLGLAIVKSLVEMHRGRVLVSSELGMGSTFTIELPAVRTLGIDRPTSRRSGPRR